MNKFYVKDISEDLGVVKRTVIKYCQQGFLPAHKELVKGKEVYSISIGEYQAWKRKHFGGLGEVRISKTVSKERDLSKNEIRAQWMPEWLDWLKFGKLGGRLVGPRMIEMYDYYFNYFLNLLPPRAKTPIVSVENFRYVLGKIPVEKYSTRYNVFSSLMSITKYLIEKKEFTLEEREKLKLLRPRRYFPARRPCITQEQLDKVIEFIDNSKKASAYDRLLSKSLILFITNTGLRASEVANLKLQDVDFEAKLIHVICGKGRKNRRVGMNKQNYEVLSEYLKLRFAKFPRQDRFFLTGTGTPMKQTSIHQKIERVAQNFSFHFSPHALRRSFVTINVNKGKPLVHLQIACGHADITTTRSYCQTSEDEVLEAMKEW